MLKKGIILAMVGASLFTSGIKVFADEVGDTDSYNTVTDNPRQKFIDSIKDDAISLAHQYDLYPSLMMAQAIIESGNGQSQLASAPNYNLFGVKACDSYEASVGYQTTEVQNGISYTTEANFRVYPSYKESLEDYADLLKYGTDWDHEYYQNTWRSVSDSYEKAAEGLVGKYATDPEYAQKLIEIIQENNLAQYDDQQINTMVAADNNQNTSSVVSDTTELPAYDGKDYNTSGSYPFGQCTWYVYNRMYQLGMKVDDYMGNGGQWGNTAERLGYEVSNIPEQGTAVSVPPGELGSDPAYGHVAFVEKVNEDGSIAISECNVVNPGSGTVSERTVSKDIAQTLTYIKGPYMEKTVNG